AARPSPTAPSPGSTGRSVFQSTCCLGSDCDICEGQRSSAGIPRGAPWNSSRPVSGDLIHCPALPQCPYFGCFMEYDITLLIVLALVGLLAGGINTIAGGGSNLTLPVLMLLGLPADVANGTNRVAVVLQCIVGIRGFNSHGRLDVPAIMPIMIPTLIGGVLGALAAALIPPIALKPILLGTIISMSLLILLRPGFVTPPPGTPVLSVSQSRMAWWSLFAAG